MEKTDSFRIQEKKSADITIPFGDGEITYEYPFIGPVREYSQVKYSLPGFLGVATAEQTITILDHALKNRGNDLFNLVIKAFETFGVTTSTSALYVPDSGIYFQDRPSSSLKSGVNMDENELKRALEYGNDKVRFFKFGTQPSGLPISKKPSVIALCGEKSAQQLEEIASNEGARCVRHIMGHVPGNKPTIRKVEVSFNDNEPRSLYLGANKEHGASHSRYILVHKLSDED